jgi:hypothetical protein
MTSKSPFKWRHFLPEIILWGVRWYCLYSISYRNLEEMMCDRGVESIAVRFIVGSRDLPPIGQAVSSALEANK